MKTSILRTIRKFYLMGISLLSFQFTQAQTNVFDDIISQSANHTYLTAAINQQNLAGALQDDAATLTVFAPTDAAFDQLAAALNTNIAGLLALPNLTDILLYHVLGSIAPSSAITNGLMVTPLNSANTIKMSITSNGVFANHAQVTTPDLIADNGVVHVINEVILPNFTLVDLALLEPDFSILTTAVIEKGFLPVVTNPFATLTILAPTDAAFQGLMTALGINVGQLLALDNLDDILLYHIFDTEIFAADLSNGLIAAPMSNTNTLKVTVGSSGVFFNQAQVINGDVTDASNGVVHVLSSVLLPVTTVVDVAINNDFNYLAAALIQEQLLPVLTNPLAQFTVFAPTDEAFEDLAEELNTDIAGLLALPNLSSILLYHVAPSAINAASLTNGPLAMASGVNSIINVDGGVTINQANVTTADITAANGVVHVIDGVILPNFVNIEKFNQVDVTAFPNPTTEFVTLAGIDNATLRFVDLNGAEVLQTVYNGNAVDVSNLASGMYFIYVSNEQNQHVVRLSIK